MQSGLLCVDCGCLPGTDPEPEAWGGVLILDRGYIEVCGPGRKKGVLRVNFFQI